MSKKEVKCIQHLISHRGNVALLKAGKIYEVVDTGTSWEIKTEIGEVLRVGKESDDEVRLFKNFIKFK